MSGRSRTTTTTTVGLAVIALALTSCSRGSDSNGEAVASANGSGECPDVVATASDAVTAALDVAAAWEGPTDGPAAETDKTLVFVAQTLTNPGVSGVAKGVQEAAEAIGWDVRVLDGQGDSAGITSAMGQAVALAPDGIVIGGFDPATVSSQLSQADAAGIPVIGWHAVAEPGPSTDPMLFTNVTTNVDDVALISAQYIIAQSDGTAGVVVFTDDSIPFAAGKAQMIQDDLAECSSVMVLDKQNIPIPDAGTRTPQAFSSLVSSLGDEWTYSVAINDLYFDNAATPLRAAGKQGSGAPFNVGAGDGSEAAFSRIASGEFQAATVPEPLSEQGWQIVDEFNRAFAGADASGYVAPVHVTDASNVGDSTSWEPDNGYRDEYQAIWGG